LLLGKSIVLCTQKLFLLYKNIFKELDILTTFFIFKLPDKIFYVFCKII